MLHPLGANRAIRHIRAITAASANNFIKTWQGYRADLPLLA
jgi:hypothetical protein